MQIHELSQVTDEVLEALRHLMPQLTDIAPPSRDELEQIISSPACRLFLARDPDTNGKIIGTATLAAYQTPTGVHAWIEDVVVDTDYRGRGIGEALSRIAIEAAVGMRAKSISLTSNPSREAANRLYQRLGFVKWETNLYRYPMT
ncbi:MAG: GNAT family N-acetyltransferase [Anaerolineaceae bacterium]|nr:GNAT family N-acetyltransferase [Anaerolineaceae bacterium]